MPIGAQQYSTETVAGRLVKLSLPIYLWCLRASPTRLASLEHELFRLCDSVSFPIERLFAHYGEVTNLSSVQPHVVPQEHWGCASAIGAVVGLNVPPVVLHSGTLWFASVTQTDPSGLVFPLGISPPASEDQLAWSYPYGLYIGAPEPFYQVSLTLWSGGQGRIFGPMVVYPTDTDAAGLITRWRYADVTQDGTNGLTGSGTIQFSISHGSWKRGRIPIQWQDGDLFSSESSLYWIRVLASFSGQPPRLRGLRLPSWVVIVRIGDSMVCVNLGWRYENDWNSDGYIDDTEFYNRIYPNAAARRVYYARVGAPINLHGVKDSSPGWYLARIWDPRVRELMVEAYARWLEQPRGYRGVVLREAAAPPGGSGMPIQSGGRLCDGFSNDPVQSAAFQEGLMQYGSELLHELKRLLPARSWLMVWRSQDQRPYATDRMFAIRDRFEAQVVYGAVMEYTGLFGSSGLCRDWDYQAVAASGGRTIFVAVPVYPFVVGHSEASWKRALTTAFAQYLLRHLPGATSVAFHPHGIPALPARNRATRFGIDYYRGGVPYSVAYLPYRLMQVPIGVPTTIPQGYQPVPLVHQDENGWNANSVIGDSASTQVTVTIDGSQYVVPLAPTHVFVLHPQTGWTGQEQDLVIARAFTNGLVLYRCRPTTANMNDSAYRESVLQVNLPDSYRIVDYDGTAGPSISSVSLRGWQGLILLRSNS